MNSAYAYAASPAPPSAIRKTTKAERRLPNERRGEALTGVGVAMDAPVLPRALPRFQLARIMTLVHAIAGSSRDARLPRAERDVRGGVRQAGRLLSRRDRG